MSPAASGVNIQGSQHSIQGRIQAAALSAGIKDQASFKIARENVADLGLPGPLGNGDLRNLSYKC
jgi:hypothetical protein